jgi:hypothetical protein
MSSPDNIGDLTNSRRRAESASARLRSSTSTAPEVKLVIHHQFAGIELVSPVYAYDSATCYLSPDQKVVVGSTTQAGFNIDLAQGEPIGILMYELKNMKQSNMDTISSEDETKCIKFFMVWKIINSKKFYINWHIIVHDKGRIWDRDKLIELAKWSDTFNIQHSPIEETYLMHNNTALMTRVNVTCEEECYKLEMTISETSIKHNTWRPWHFEMDG